jgi:hypothetical protein
VAVPFLESGREGRFLIAVLNCFVIVCAVAAVGRTLLSFVIISLLALAALLFYWLSLEHNDRAHLAHACSFAAALNLATIIYLLMYVFRPEVMTADKLFGAAAAYLMIGSFWATLYALTDMFYLGSFVGLGDEHRVRRHCAKKSSGSGDMQCRAVGRRIVSGDPHRATRRSLSAVASEKRRQSWLNYC